MVHASQHMSPELGQPPACRGPGMAPPPAIAHSELGSRGGQGSWDRPDYVQEEPLGLGSTQQQAGAQVPFLPIPFFCPARSATGPASSICAEMAWVVLAGVREDVSALGRPTMLCPARGPGGSRQESHISQPGNGLPLPCPVPTHPCRNVEMRVSFTFSCSSSLATVKKARQL